ncbi:MAG: hypothetical protein EA378_04625 [Phycisphaerales bacterium]|nr:MAG: hypothetical protein EA378_04625 [Phycisphaerales bacterium]
MRIVVLMLLAVWLGVPTGCGARVRPAFESPDPSSRLAAMVQAADRGDQRAVPRLIEALDSDDPAVRLVAIAALDRLTGQTHGYAAYAPERERQAAVDRWVAWHAGSDATSAGRPEAEDPR